MYLALFIKMSVSFFGSWFLHPYPHSRHNILLLWFSSSFLSNIYDTTTTTTATTINGSDATKRIRSIFSRQRECYKDLQVYHSSQCTATNRFKLNTKYSKRYKYLQAFQSSYGITDRRNGIVDNSFYYSCYCPYPRSGVAFNQHTKLHRCFLSNQAFDQNKRSKMFNVQHEENTLEKHCHRNDENKPSNEDEMNNEVVLSSEQLRSFSCESNTNLDTNDTSILLEQIHNSPNTGEKLNRTTINRKWIVCHVCNGEGRIFQKSRRVYKHQKNQKHQQKSVQEPGNESETIISPTPTPTKELPTSFRPCHICSCSGLLPFHDSSNNNQNHDEKNPINHNNIHEQDTSKRRHNVPSYNVQPDPVSLKVAIIGGGIGGLALCSSLRHRNFSDRFPVSNSPGHEVMVFERDATFDTRHQGYGLTLQQASKQLKALGIRKFDENDNKDYQLEHDQKENAKKRNTNENSSNHDGITDDTQHHIIEGGMKSTRHIVHSSEGRIIGKWGVRHWLDQDDKKDDSNNQSSNDGGLLESVTQSVDQIDEAKSKRKCIKQDTNPTNNILNVHVARQNPIRQNVHIARQALRYELYKAAMAGCDDEEQIIKWNHKLIHYEYNELRKCMELQFLVNEYDIVTNQPMKEHIKTYYADMIVGTDGIRSQVRNILFGTNETKPLRYLSCIVILGICKVHDVIDIIQKNTANLNSNENTTTSIQHALSLLDGQTVFQTADGTTRIYSMPFAKGEYMWQLSFPVLDESDAIQMSNEGSANLLRIAKERCGQWHEPIPSILEATTIPLCSGYPVYDRDIITTSDFESRRCIEDDPITPLSDRDTIHTNHNINNYGNRFVTLLGDAAHPMSPFKGQGANQAMLDALYLSRSIYRNVIVQPRKEQSKNEQQQQKRQKNDELDEMGRSTNDVNLKNSVDKAGGYNSNGDLTNCTHTENRLTFNKVGLIEKALREFEAEMIPRSAAKVKASAEAAVFLHTQIAIQEGNVTRGGAAKAEKAARGKR